MATEYRLVTERPGYQGGRATQVFAKRDYTHARDALQDWYRDQERYANTGLAAWDAHLESREVSVWEPVVFDEVEGIPV